MPRFCFNVRTVDGTVIPDWQGIAFSDLAAARADALDAAKRTVEDHGHSGAIRDFEAIEILDGTGKVVAVVPFANGEANEEPPPNP